LNAARLGLGNVTGSIEKGLEADIVFLNTNPLDDIGNIRDVDLVVNNGIDYDPQSLMEKARALVD